MSLVPVVLAGRRVRLEPLSAAHARSLSDHAADAEIWRFMPYARPDPQDSLRAWLAGSEIEQAKGNLFFAIVDQVTGQAVGGTAYLDYAEKDRRVEIGATWLGRACWRTAVNTACKRLLLAHAFDELKMNRVQLKTDARNSRSQRAIERIGGVKEGVWRHHMIMPDGHLRDTVMYSILAGEWPAVKQRLDAMLAV